MNVPWSGPHSRSSIVAVAGRSDALLSGGGRAEPAPALPSGDPISPADLRALWDFTDPEVSADRFLQAALAATTSTQRDELLTQRARALGLAGRPGTALALLDSLTSHEAVVLVRVDLERGRLLRADGDSRGAVAHFQAASDLASEHGITHLTVAALHMLALADAGREKQWTYRGLAVASGSRDPETRRWLVPLHNNLGWHLHDEEQYAEALEHFQRALAVAHEMGRGDDEWTARWAVARCLRSLRRTRQALAMQRELLVLRPDDEDAAEEIAILELLTDDQPRS